MNFTFTWILDKFGFVPKFEKSTIDLQEWPFPVKEPKPVAKKVAKKSVKIPKATTRKPRATKKTK
jgi:hypothetical protein